MTTKNTATRVLAKSAKRQKGDAFERQACDLVQAQGWQIIATNYTAPRLGEIDIIAKRDRTLAFIEVRARKRSDFADALGSVTPAKQRKIIATAEHFLQADASFGDCDCRFDVIGFDINQQNVLCQWIEAAFGL